MLVPPSEGRVERGLNFVRTERPSLSITQCLSRPGCASGVLPISHGGICDTYHPLKWLISTVEVSLSAPHYHLVMQD